MSDLPEIYIFIYHDAVADDRRAVLAPNRVFASDFLPDGWRSKTLPEPKQYDWSEIDNLAAEAREDARSADAKIDKNWDGRRVGLSDADRQEAYARREAFCDNLTQIKRDLIKRGYIKPDATS